MASSVTPERSTGPDGLPDGVKAEKAVRQLHVPSGGPLDRYAPAFVAVAYDALREREGESIPAGQLASLAWSGSWVSDFQDAGEDAEAWCERFLVPLLPQLPGVSQSESDVRWVFDAETARRSAVPEDPTHPDDETIRDALTAAETAGEVSHSSLMNYRRLRDAYAYIRENATATRADLRDHLDAGSWWVEWWNHVGHPELGDLPGVESPVMPAGEWRFVGVSADGAGGENHD